MFIFLLITVMTVCVVRFKQPWESHARGAYPGSFFGQWWTERKRDLAGGEFQFHFETSSRSAVFLTVTFVLRSPPTLSRPSTLSLLQQRILSTTPAFFDSSSCCLPSTISMSKNPFDRQGTVAFDRQENSKSGTLIPSSEFLNRGEDVQVYLT